MYAYMYVHIHNIQTGLKSKETRKNEGIEYQHKGTPMIGPYFWLMIYYRAISIGIKIMSCHNLTCSLVLKS